MLTWGYGSALAVGFLLLTSSAYPQAASRNAVTAVRFWSFGDATRVVIETTGEFQFRSDRAKDPDRLFFDILAAGMRLGKRGQHTFPVNDARLRQIRVAETVPGVTRIVFDVAGDVEHSASQLTNPDRLIVELKAVDPKASGNTTPKILTELPAAPASMPVATSSAEARTSQTPVAAVTQAAAKTAPLPRTEIAVSEPLRAEVPSPPPLPKQSIKLDKVPPPPAVARPAKISAENHSMTRVLGLKVGRIVLDAGHGGHDTGTCGPGGLFEKDVVLDVTRRLGTLIETRMGAEVIYTRSDDTFVALEARTALANERKADLFLSIHANSSPESNASGVETYYLNFTSSKSAMDVAARENASSQKTVYELKDLLQKIALQDKVDESREFAESIQQALYSASARANSRTRDRGVKKAPFVVLIGAAMPSILAEIGFVSNPKDEAMFKKPEFRQKVAEGLFKGLQRYAASLSQFEVASKN